MTAVQPMTNPVTRVLRDVRFLQLVGQVVFALAVMFAVYAVAASIVWTLESKDASPNFAFLNTTAGFDVGEPPAWYSSSSFYWEAYLVGIINTLRVVTVGLILSTVIGVFVGVFLLSTNWLVRTIAKTYVEILRNTPLLVQLFVWYFIVMFSLPAFRDSIALPQAGLTVVPLRTLACIALLVVVLVREGRHGRHAARFVLPFVGILAAAVTIEAGFWLRQNQPDWRGAYGAGDLTAPTFLFYLVVSLLLVLAAWFVPAPRRRAVLLGAAVGQFVGGLLFWFGIVPLAAFRWEIEPAMYANIKGIVFAQILPTARFAEWMAFVVVGVVAALGLSLYLTRQNEDRVDKIPATRYAVITFIVIVVLGWLVVTLEPAPALVPVAGDGDAGTSFVPLANAEQDGLLTLEDRLLYSQQPLLLSLPERNNFRFTSGLVVSPEYMALLLGLVIYTSAFIAEIVRAGIQAVPFGQVEAARALGLNNGQVLRMVILPQALRVIIPPLGNQYLNLAKNSSLAIAVAYADIYQISFTMASTSGQSVPVFLMVMITYLIGSLTIAFGMNLVNRRFQLVTR